MTCGMTYSPSARFSVRMRITSPGFIALFQAMLAMNMNSVSIG